MNKKIVIYSSGTEHSRQVESLLRECLEGSGITATDALSPDVELIVCIGGDGTFLQAVHTFGFPGIPFIGINTGHLGFYQEIMPDQIDLFLENYSEGRYRLQNMHCVKAIVRCDGVETEFAGLNEIVIRSALSNSVHLDISIGGAFIERFSGDGILIASPAGSTAYNYSLGGSIVDPRLRLLQVTPIAPMNTIAYRSFTSSILLPPDLSLGIVPDTTGPLHRIRITYDSNSFEFDHIDDIEVKLSDVSVDLIRFESYDFWNKVKSKFL